MYVDQQAGGYFGETAAAIDGDQFQPAAAVRIVSSAGEASRHTRTQ